MNISKDEYLAWRENHVTKLFFSHLSKEYCQRLEMWGDGEFSGLEADKVQIQAMTLKDISELTYEAITEQDDGE